MASNPICSGSPRKPEVPDGHAGRCAWLLAGALLAGMPASGSGQPRLLEPERAFAFSARALDERTVEARFAIADGYYLYRDKLRFRVDPGALAAAPSLPQGKVKQDEFFGKVETYRGSLPIRLDLDRAAPGQAVTVIAESQGCADLGVCYPPAVQKVVLTLPPHGTGAGPVVEAAPSRKSWFK
jgi:thiol:disulfide interchange protein DsbD